MRAISKKQIDDFLEARLEADYWFSFDEKKQWRAINSALDVINGAVQDAYKMVLHGDGNFDLEPKLLRAAAYAAYACISDNIITSKKLSMMGGVMIQEDEECTTNDKCGCSAGVSIWQKVSEALSGFMPSSAQSVKLKIAGGRDY